VTLYATHDTLNRIAALLSGLSKGDTVRFDVSMFTDGVPLEVGTKKFFDVTGYTPTISKSFT
jgi:hypothetical protein